MDENSSQFVLATEKAGSFVSGEFLMITAYAIITASFILLTLYLVFKKRRLIRKLKEQSGVGE